jgi:hypothetical protein
LQSYKPEPQFNLHHFTCLPAWAPIEAMHGHKGTRSSHFIWALITARKRATTSLRFPFSRAAKLDPGAKEGNPSFDEDAAYHTHVDSTYSKPPIRGNETAIWSLPLIDT